jgi:hypothetical protein
MVDAARRAEVLEVLAEVLAEGGQREPTAPAAPPPPGTIPEQTGRRTQIKGLIGVDVSNGQDTIGEVSGIRATEAVVVEAVVVDVGGFLNLRQKRVALAWDSLTFTEQDGKRMFRVSATREQLEGMPALKTLEEKQGGQATQQQQ